MSLVDATDRSVVKCSRWRWISKGTHHADARLDLGGRRASSTPSIMAGSRPSAMRSTRACCHPNTTLFPSSRPPVSGRTF